MTPEHPHHEIINRDPRYHNVDAIPLGGSLEDTQYRVLAAWNDILASIRQQNEQTVGSNKSDYTLVVAHANTLRSLVMHLDNIEANEIEALSIPTAIPFYYDINKSTGEVVSGEDRGDTNGQFRGIYISESAKTKFS